jgi:hypothetical protein
VQSWLGRLAVWLTRGTETSSLPEGATDDLSVPLPSGQTVDELVDHVIRGLLRHTDEDALARELVTRFNLSSDDAWLVLDRTRGGIVRAATLYPGNRPPRDKDPVAWTSFQRATEDPSVIAALHPQKRE